MPRSNLRSRVLAFLARRFGSVFVLALVQQAERRSPYDTDLEATRAMAADERVHEEVVRGLAARGRARVSGSFRAAVFGANDGLVSNLALVLGVAGGGASTATVLLTGLSGLLSGALSMGAGEYISVRSQRELLAASTPHTADAPQVLPHLDVDANELALVYRARGIPADEAQRRAAALLADTGAAVDVPQDEAGDVVGSGWGAATSSFAFFASGAAVPVLPFLVGLQGTTALLVAGVWSGGVDGHRGHRRRALGRPPLRARCASWPSAPARPRSPTAWVRSSERSSPDFAQLAGARPGHWPIGQLPG